MSAPNLKEIEWAISELENQESSESRYILLAALYTCRDQMQGRSTQQAAAYTEPAPDSRLDCYGDSEFLQTVAGLPAKEAWSIMDELMETLQVANPRVYEGVMRKLTRL